MKATQKDFRGQAARAAREARVFFLCGPDEAGAQDAAEHLAALLPEPGERIELAGSDLRRDPVRLSDEARSTSLFGGTRHIWIRASGDEAHDAIENLLADPTEGCPVLVVAGTADSIAGSPQDLAALIPGAEAVAIERRDHMRTVGDRLYKEAVTAFLRRRP